MINVIDQEIPLEVEQYLACDHYPCILEKLMNKRGQITSITYQTDLVLRKKLEKTKDQIKGVRIVYNRLMRVGINYENRAATIAKREDGIEKSKLRGLEWVAYPYLLKNKDNDLYFRFYPFGSNEPIVKYFLNGEEYSWDNISEFFLANGQFSGYSEVVNIKVENIIEVK